MGNDMKVAVIGGGSSYTPELIEGFIESRNELPIKRINLMDIDPRRLEIVGGLARRMLSASGAEIELELTSDRAEAIEGSAFIISQIRVGGMAARILDEKIPLQYGVIGQETTGPGGFAKALRTIPVALAIASDIEKLAPDGILINFTNPAGLITEALHRYSSVNAIGLCNLPIGAEMRIARRLGVNRNQIALDWVGLNHLNWIRGATLDGEDIWPQVFEQELEEARQNPTDGWNFPAELLEQLGMIPCGYLNYYYNRDSMYQELKTAPRSRGEEVREIEEQLLRMYQDPELKEKPALLEKRGGAYYSKAAVSLIAAIANDKKETHIVNTANEGTLPGLGRQDVVEVPSQIGAQGARPHLVEAMPPEIRGLVQAVKAYEQLAAKAGAEGDRQAALQAMLAHPLVPSFQVARELLHALLQAHRAYLPQFFPEDSREPS
jgi:6-phospho-beta-glucosidase